MWAARVSEGYVFGELTPATVETLTGVPMLINPAASSMRQRASIAFISTPVQIAASPRRGRATRPPRSAD